jgi:hypothetical protein
VQRTDPRVVVDLNEGVISVGEAPRAGSTLGALVTAPAHVELAWSDPSGTMVVSHDPASVRPAAQVGPLAALKAPVIAPSPMLPKADTTAQRSTGPVAAAGHPQGAGQASPPAPPAGPPVDPNAEQTIVAAVRACIGSHPGGDGVQVTVETTVSFNVDDDGMVRHGATFWHPIGEKAQNCALDVISRTRFDHGGPVSFRVVVTN